MSLLNRRGWLASLLVLLRLKRKPVDVSEPADYEAIEHAYNESNTGVALPQAGIKDGIMYVRVPDLVVKEPMASRHIYGISIK